MKCIIGSRNLLGSANVVVVVVFYYFFGFGRMLSKARCTMAGLVRCQSLLRNQGHIGGRWTECKRTFPVFNPATGQEIGQVADMGQSEAQDAVQHAYGALKS